MWCEIFLCYRIKRVGVIYVLGDLEGEVRMREKEVDCEGNVGIRGFFKFFYMNLWEFELLVIDFFCLKSGFVLGKIVR